MYECRNYPYEVFGQSRVIVTFFYIRRYLLLTRIYQQVTSSESYCLHDSNRESNRIIASGSVGCLARSLPILTIFTFSFSRSGNITTIITRRISPSPGWFYSRDQYYGWTQEKKAKIQFWPSCSLWMDSSTWFWTQCHTKFFGLHRFLTKATVSPHWFPELPLRWSMNIPYGTSLSRRSSSCWPCSFLYIIGV